LGRGIELTKHFCHSARPATDYCGWICWLLTFRHLLDVEGHTLIFLQGFEAFSLNFREGDRAKAGLYAAMW
jgi:hypothetical protein